MWLKLRTLSKALVESSDALRQNLWKHYCELMTNLVNFSFNEFCETTAQKM